MKKALIFTIAVLQLAVCVFTSCGSKQKEKEIVPFETMKIKQTDRVIDLKFAARIKGKQDVNVIPRVDGQITSIYVTEGQIVRKGQALFTIDNRPFKAQLEQAQANVLSAKAREAQARLEYESNQDLYNQKIVSDYVIKEKQIALENARAAISVAQAQVQAVNINLSYCTVTSPVSGIVGTIPYRVGDMISPAAGKEFTTISDNSTVTAEFSFSENDLMTLKQVYPEFESDMNALLKYSPAVKLQLKNGTIYDITGKLVTMSGVVDLVTGSVACKADFPNPKAQLNSGTSGSVLIPIHYQDIMLIPQTATVRMQDQTIVYVVDKEGKAKATVISIEPISDGKEYIVNEGLKEGDEIVKIGANNVQDGQVVKIVKK